MTRRSFPLPKVRVTLRSWGAARPHEAQSPLDEIAGDDKERTGGPNFDDRFGFDAGERATADDTFDFAGAVPLPLGNLAREDDAFEVEDREVVIFKFFSSVNGYYIVQRTNKVANPCDGLLWHA